jgi:alpha-beta hydrolase superfamily lysophospholipase
MLDSRVSEVEATLSPSPRDITMQPITFEGRLGWLHMSPGLSSGTGVVLVSAIGREARCAHMPMRLLADQFAAAGFPTIRYDHLGAGDSLDLPDETADAVGAWIGGVGLAADALRARAGVQRVVLGGLRLGATFAAINSGPVDGLLLLAPVLNGRSWIRRLRFAARLSKTDGQPQGDADPLDTDGLWLSGATAASLAQIDLAKAPIPGAPVFVAAQNQLVSAYAAALSKSGAKVRTIDFPGFNELYLEPATNSPPDLVFESARAWLIETFGGSISPANPVPGAPSEEAVLRPPGAVERSVVFGTGLRGVICEPDQAADHAPTVIFCNAGGDPRAGSGGFATRAARLLAMRGVASLRFDFAGLGDSAMPDGEVRCHVFETPREADIDAAVELLSEHGYEQFVTVGVCSGAYHALRAGWRNRKVMGVFAISPLKIIWRPGDSVSFARDEYLLSLKVYTRALFDPEAWKLAVEKKISVFEFLLALANRFRNRVFGSLTRRGEVSPLTEIQRLAHRGGRAAFVMGVNDTSLEEVETYFGPKGAKLRGLKSVSVEVIPELDHGLARRASREIATDRLIRWLAPATHR